MKQKTTKQLYKNTKDERIHCIIYPSTSSFAIQKTNYWDDRKKKSALKSFHIMLEDPPFQSSQWMKVMAGPCF